MSPPPTSRKRYISTFKGLKSNTAEPHVIGWLSGIPDFVQTSIVLVPCTLCTLPCIKRPYSLLDDLVEAAEVVPNVVSVKQTSRMYAAIDIIDGF